MAWFSFFENAERRMIDLVDWLAHACGEPIQPATIAHRLRRVMHVHREVHLTQVVVPNRYRVRLAPEDFARVSAHLTSYAALPATDKAAIKDYDIRFHGFDGNNETLFMAYAEFFCGDDRFTDVARTGEFNSHYPARDGYRAMYAELQKISSERWGKMSKDEMLAVINAK